MVSKPKFAVYGFEDVSVPFQYVSDIDSLKQKSNKWVDNRKGE